MKKVLLMLLVMLGTASIALAQRTVRGTVTDENGETLIGATVIVQGTSIGVTTNLEGQFAIEVPAGSDVLVFSYTGYSTRTVTLGASNVADVVLTSDVLQLETAVVVGYGVRAKRLVTSSIASVGDEAFKNVSVQSYEQALAGRMPGVVIGGNAGTLGAQQNIRVRGVGSINANNQPLFVVDGLIMNADVSGAVLGGPGTNPLQNIDPNDIESVDVLKDAAAAAIYGARGANGVVLITTKSGNYNQKPTVNLNYYAGTSDPTNMFDLMSGREYAAYWNQAARNRGFTPETNPTLFYDVDNQPEANWLDLVTQTGIVQEMGANVSGGTSTMKYFLGGSFRNEDGYVVSTNLKRYNFRLNLEQQINNKLKAGMQLNPSRTINTRMNEDNNVAAPLTFAALFFPNVDPFDENGNTRGGVLATSIGRTNFPGSPLANIEGQDVTLTINQVLANTYAEYRPIQKLSLRTEFGAQVGTYDDFYKAASYTTDGFGADGVGTATSRQVTNWSWSNTAMYSDQVGRHSYDAMLGYTMNRESISTMTVSGNTFADDRLKTLNSAAEITSGGGTFTDVTFLGYFARGNYALDNKYLLSASIRADGSSRFGVNNRFGFFPAVSAGWIVSDESFMAGNGVFDYLKLRGSWGQTGNAGIGNFDARGLVGFGTDYNFAPGFLFNRLENADLRWERNTTTDVGFEFGILKNRVSGSFAYYHRYTSDLLLDVPIPFTTGIVNSVITQNAGEVVNSGIEFLVDVNILDGPFKWNLGFNGATVRNEIKRLVDNDGDGKDDDIVIGQQILRTGESLGSWFLTEYAGVDPNNGDALFNRAQFDDDGNLVGFAPSNMFAEGINRQIFGSYIPKFTGGITSTMSFKGVTLFMLWQAATGFNLYRNEGRFVANNGAATWNMERTQLNSWTPENPNTDVPEARLLLPNGNQHSTRYLSAGDFLRLRTLQLSYDIPPFGRNNTRVRVFAAGQNLLTFTNFDGLDPEASGQVASGVVQGNIFFSRPQARQVTFGVNVTL
jgi:TonB-linked SusC/RagA family outer membrane protein